MLEPSANTERAAISIQKNIYEAAKTFINFAGREDGISDLYMKRLKCLLIGKDELLKILESTQGEEQAALAVYMFNMIFLHKNFMTRYINDTQNITDPWRQFESNLKMRTIEDIMTAYRVCFTDLGGRKDLMIEWKMR